MKNGLMLSSLLVLSAVALADDRLSTVSEATTHSVLEHHWMTFVDNDLDGVMVDYTDKSVIITPHKTYRGLKEIRDNFVAAYEHFPKKVSTLTLTKSEVHDDVGYIIWNANSPKGRLVFATDTFVVRGGKIVSQTFGGVDASP